MTGRHDIDGILNIWPYKPGAISARRLHAADGRDVLQMRVELGVLQMEISGRPDGTRPRGSRTYLDWLRQQSVDEDGEFILGESQCEELDREFVQYYHRRVCWLALREFSKAVEDADHTLAMMDFALLHSPSEEWTISHEQYRCFVLFHRTQAAALAELEKAGPEAAVRQIRDGLEQIHEVFQSADAEEQFEDDEQVSQLVQLQEWIGKEYNVGHTLEEQLAEAVAAEQYERAAKLRDQIARRRSSQHSEP